MYRENIHFSARNPAQQQLRSDPTASQTAPSHHSYPTPQNWIHHHPFALLAPHDPSVDVVVVMEVVAAAGMGTLALYVDKLVGAVVVEGRWGLAGTM